MDPNWTPVPPTPDDWYLVADGLFCEDDQILATEDDLAFSI